jgi:DNA-binding transcriptional LysR family regulator
VDLRHLRYFVAVGEERHMGRAAGRLHVAQPALSRQMKDLEDELDVILLDRNSRGVELTPAGAALLASARLVLEQTASAVDRVRRAAAGLEGRLVIGASRPVMWREFLPRAVEAVAAELPHVALDVQEIEAGPVMWDAVRTGALDLALGMMPPRLPGLRAEAMLDSTFDCALLPASHPLAARASIAPEDLRGLPLLWTTPEVHPALLAAVVDEVERLGISGPRQFVFSGPHACWLAVASGRGWSPVSRAMTDWSPDGTRAVPVEGLRVPLANSAIWRAEDQSDVLRLVLESLRRFRDGQRGRKRTSGSSRKPARPPGPPAPIPVGLELRHLRACAELHGGASFGQAATALGLTQPALSKQITDLEHEVGVSICVRAARGVSLTPAGESLATDAARVLEALADLRAEMVRARRLQEQTVVVGAIEMASTNPRMLHLVRTCSDRFRGLQIVVREHMAHTLVAALEEGAIDVALAPLGIADGNEQAVDTLMFTSDVIDCALIPANHPLAAKPELQRSDLGGMPYLLVTQQTSPDFYARGMRTVEAAGIRIGSVITYDSVQTVWASIAQGKGWSFGVGRHRAQPPSGCKAVAIEGLSLPWGLEMMWRKGERIAAIQNLVAVARELADDEGPRGGGRGPQASR